MTVKGTAAFSVGATTRADVELDSIDGLTPNEVAALVDENTDVYVSVCHHCSRHVSNPEADQLMGFTLDGVDYARDDNGDWLIVGDATGEVHGG